MNFRTLKSSADTFFSGKEPLLVGIGNRPELEHRLTWLSEGSLRFHLKGDTIPHGGNPNEIQLHRDWLNFLANKKPWQQWTDAERDALTSKLNERYAKSAAMKKAITQTAENAKKLADETNPYARS